MEDRQNDSLNASHIPFFRPSIGEKEVAAVTECLRSGWLTTGKKCVQFENDFAEYLGGGVHAIAVNSATAALHLALEALGLGPGDEVILPTLTFTATAEVIHYLGATPVFADVQADTFCISPDAVADLITERTRAIMPVHFAGRACDMTSLRALADKHDLVIVDDAAHALPATHAGKLIGQVGANATAFSFYANKTITTGEGGMLVTRDENIAARARIMRLHGIDRDVFARFTSANASWFYDVVAPGLKYNLTDIAAALGSVQLARADDFHQTRQKHAARYDAALANLPLILPPHAAHGDMHSWHLYIVRMADNSPMDRDELISYLKNHGVSTSVHYRPLHQMTMWEPYCKGRAFPNADKIFKTCVSLPHFMSMTDAEHDRVVELMRGALGG